MNSRERSAQSPAAAVETPLGRWLAQRIERDGPITFEEFMRECLYHPQWGYYSQPERIRFADFYTSVDVHPVFGRLLARQLDEMWRLLGSPARFQVVEGAAGTGRLASQILDFAARELPEFYAAIDYVAVEVSDGRRGEHARLLAQHIEAGKVSSSADLPSTIPVGCILSNELLDALPVHRVVEQNGELREVYVGLRDGALVEELGSLSTLAIAEYSRRQSVVLHDGQQAEAGLALCRWIEEAGRALQKGFVLTVDYGHEAAELYSARHMDGTLLAYADHRTSPDVLRSPGQRDLTAHVNFTALDLWGQGAGLERTGSASQMAFLLAMGRGNEFADLYQPGDDEMERLNSRLKLKTLIHPEGMGETFRVFIQHKGIAAPQLTGLSGI